MSVTPFRALLINPKATYADEVAQKCFPPLGLLYLASSLQKAGFAVEVVDANALRLEDAAIAARVVEARADLVGLALYAETLSGGARTLRTIRAHRPGVRCVVGGPQASAAPRWILEQVPEVDYVIVGEAEESLVLLARQLSQGQEDSFLTPIPGLLARGALEEPRAARIADLDSLPLPARWAVRQVYDQQLYYALLVPQRNIDCLITSRGCPFSCRFCYNRQSKVRYRSIDGCLEELELLRSRDIRTVEILDDNFTASEDRALCLLDRIAAERLPLKLRLKARADSITEPLLRAALKAGVYQISVGAESGSPELLRAMNKNITVAQIERSVRAILEHGINCHTSWILGYPGESPATLNSTTELVRRLKPTTAGFSLLVPYPGTQVYEEAKRAGTLRGDWSAASPSVPWVKLSWTRTYEDLKRAQRAVRRRVYWQPHYAYQYGKRIVLGANATLARYAWQELGRTLGLGKK